MTEFNTLVFVGRMQPFHNGHKAVIDKALEHAKEVVIVLGSAFQPRSAKNPFTFEQRKFLIENAYWEKTERIKVVGVMDYPYDDNAWVSAVQGAVDSVKMGGKTGLIGHSKDHSSFYLKIFPDWRDHIEVDNVDGINATDIRYNYFKSEGPEPFGYANEPVVWWDKIPVNTKRYLDAWKRSHREKFDYIAKELLEVERYQESWGKAPFAPTFVTTDAVIHQSGYILLIKRGGFPFKDQWALPGGYLDMGQFITDNMVKELREETCIKVPEKVLKGSIKSRKTFDHPDRDPRGRTITHGFFIDLGYPDEKLPKVKGADDAAEAKWFHLSEIESEMMAFDHYHIIKHFIPTY